LIRKNDWLYVLIMVLAKKHPVNHDRAGFILDWGNRFDVRMCRLEIKKVSF